MVPMFRRLTPFQLTVDIGIAALCFLVRTTMAVDGVAVWFVVLLMAGVAYLILEKRIIAAEGEASLVKRAIGADWKGKLSAVLYALAIGLAFVSPWISLAIYAAVAITWVVPDRRMERVLAEGVPHR